MTFSEFGRRIQSNASGGTDHGAAAPVFVFGEGIRPGIVGQNPTWPANLTVNDNLPMQYDFRALYSTLLGKWFGMPQNDVASVLLKDYPVIPVIGGMA
jgi:uncharacterized protein (DUF1501 family)